MSGLVRQGCECQPTPSSVAPQHRAPAGGAEAGSLSAQEAGRYERRGAGELAEESREEILDGHSDTHPLSQREADEKRRKGKATRRR